VPQQITRRVPVQVCKDDNGNFPEEVPDVEIISATTPKVGIRSGAETEDPDRIVFG
jgi:hypothetical protein